MALHLDATTAVMTGASVSCCFFPRQERKCVTIGGFLHCCRSDYPNDALLDNMRVNVERNRSLLRLGAAHVVGHLWGTDVATVTTCLPHKDDANAPTRGFDVAVVAECLWLHHQVGWGGAWA